MSVDMKRIAASPGYRSLKSAVIHDVEQCHTKTVRTDRDNFVTSNRLFKSTVLPSCFNVTGCSEGHKFTCHHRYCDTFAWVMSRVTHYHDLTGIPAEYILNRLEERRTYWYMNYYQESNHPRLIPSRIVYLDIDPRVVSPLFHCDACGGASTHPVVCSICKRHVIYRRSNSTTISLIIRGEQPEIYPRALRPLT